MQKKLLVVSGFVHIVLTLLSMILMRRNLLATSTHKARSSLKPNSFEFALIDANLKRSLVNTNTAYNELIHVNIMARCKQCPL